MMLSHKSQTFCYLVLWEEDFDPLSWPHPTPGHHNLNKIDFTLRKKRSVWPIGIWVEDFKLFLYIQVFLYKIHPRHYGHTYPRRPRFELIYFLRMLPLMVQIFWPEVFLRNRFLKHFSLYFQCKNPTSIVAAGPWHFNLHHLRLLQHKLQLYWPIGI